MSYTAEQITERGRYFLRPRPKGKLNKKFQHRRMRRKMKNLDFVPHYNRYEAGWEQ